MKKWVILQMFRMQFAMRYLGAITFLISTAVAFKVYGLNTHYIPLAALGIGIVLWFVGFIMDHLQLYQAETAIYNEKNVFVGRVMNILEDIQKEVKK